MSDVALNEKQARFVAEYLVDLNARQAAIRAGYSQATADVQGSRLMRDARVQAAVAGGKRSVAERVAISADRVLEELARIGLSDSRRLFDAQGRLRPTTEWSAEDAACVSSFEVIRRTGADGQPEEVHKIKLWDKVASLAKVGQHLGMFVERSQQLGPDGRPIDPRQPVVFVLDRG